MFCCPAPEAGGDSSRLSGRVGVDPAAYALALRGRNSSLSSGWLGGIYCKAAEHGGGMPRSDHATRLCRIYACSILWSQTRLRWLILYWLNWWIDLAVDETDLVVLGGDDMWYSVFCQAFECAHADIPNSV